MTIRELIDALHNKLLASHTRGPVEGVTEDETDHWSREATATDVEAIKTLTATHLSDLTKEGA